jgi:lipoprotein-anchoring transpeptidase ErfK/SrfK
MWLTGSTGPLRSKTGRSALFLMLGLASWPAAGVAAERVALQGYPQGAIVVRTQERQLYLVEGRGVALRYDVAVGRPQRQWQGETRISRKLRNPTFVPPAFVRKREPGLPRAIPPGPQNPLGAAVLVLGDGTYGIHGTNEPGLIGGAVSYGCIRMRNADILELFSKVRVGTRVFVVK